MPFKPLPSASPIAPTSRTPFRRSLPNMTLADHSPKLRAHTGPASVGRSSSATRATTASANASPSKTRLPSKTSAGRIRTQVESKDVSRFKRLVSEMNKWDSRTGGKGSKKGFYQHCHELFPAYTAESFRGFTDKYRDLFEKESNWFKRKGVPSSRVPKTKSGGANGSADATATAPRSSRLASYGRHSQSFWRSPSGSHDNEGSSSSSPADDSDYQTSHASPTQSLKDAEEYDHPTMGFGNDIRNSRAVPNTQAYMDSEDQELFEDLLDNMLKWDWDSDRGSLRDFCRWYLASEKLRGQSLSMLEGFVRMYQDDFETLCPGFHRRGFSDKNKSNELLRSTPEDEEESAVEAAINGDVGIGRHRLLDDGNSYVRDDMDGSSDIYPGNSHGSAVEFDTSGASTRDLTHPHSPTTRKRSHVMLSSDPDVDVKPLIPLKMAKRRFTYHWRVRSDITISVDVKPTAAELEAADMHAHPDLYSNQPRGR